MHAQQNREGLVTITVGLLTVHIWLAIGYIWYLVLQTGFFGTGLVGWLVAGVALVFLLTIGIAFVQLLLSMLVRKILENTWVSGPGCMSGIGFYITMGALFAWALTRDLNLVLWTFLLAPLVALIAALGVTFVPQLLHRMRP